MIDVKCIARPLEDVVMHINHHNKLITSLHATLALELQTFLLEDLANLGGIFSQPYMRNTLAK
jgi:hypothetical protein